MHIGLFFKGMMTGLIVAPPIGPVALVCVQRTLSRGRIHGIISGLGAATADAILAFVVATGLAFVSSFLTEEQFWLRLVGSILICAIGVKVVLSKPLKKDNVTAGGKHIANFASGFMLTVVNPSTFLVITALFAGFGMAKQVTYQTSIALLVIGVFTGSLLSWFILCTAAEKVLGMSGHKRLALLIKATGTILVVWGTFMLLKLALCGKT